jgi:hypothetical protein
MVGEIGGAVRVRLSIWQEVRGAEDFPDPLSVD